tara:strand:- start:2461 stop:3246 length:786 start_codon:yes stop_codon:yes gene_type:complete
VSGWSLFQLTSNQVIMKLCRIVFLFTTSIFVLLSGCNKEDGLDNELNQPEIDKFRFTITESFDKADGWVSSSGNIVTADSINSYEQPVIRNGYLDLFSYGDLGVKKVYAKELRIDRISQIYFRCSISPGEFAGNHKGRINLRIGERLYNFSIQQSNYPRTPSYFELTVVNDTNFSMVTSKNLNVKLDVRNQIFLGQTKQESGDLESKSYARYWSVRDIFVNEISVEFLVGFGRNSLFNKRSPNFRELASYAVYNYRIEVQE